MTGPAILFAAQALSLLEKPPEMSETIWRVVQKRGYIDLYVLQPAKSPDDPNAMEARRPEVKVVADIDECVKHLAEKCAAGRLLRRLRIGSHGNSTAFNIGNTYISVNELRCRPDLMKKVVSFKTHFLAGFSTVTIDACYCGSGKALLIYMAGLWGVPVLSYIEAQGTEPLDEPTKGTGPARECHPDGQCYTADSDAGTFTLDTEKIWHTKPRPGCPQ
jgi:hypothetical protein